MSLFVHAGYAKAGSTFLQERVFARAPGIHYLGKTRSDYPEWLKQWHYWDDLHFERHDRELRATLDSLRRPGRPNVLSSEIFTMHGGGAAAQARRLATVAPDASVILVLRDPIERIVSFYRHLVERDGLVASLEECLDWERTPFVFYKRKPVYLADSFYDELIELHERLFAGRLLVLRLEDMLRAPARFFNELGEFVGQGFGVDGLEIDRPENATGGGNPVGRRRFENALAALEPLAPASSAALRSALTRSIPGSLAAEADDGPVLSERLRDRLAGFFRGRCHGYY